MSLEIEPCWPHCIEHLAATNVNLLSIGYEQTLQALQCRSSSSSSIIKITPCAPIASANAQDPRMVIVVFVQIDLGRLDL